MTFHRPILTIAGLAIGGLLAGCGSDGGHHHYDDRVAYPAGYSYGGYDNYRPAYYRDGAWYRDGRRYDKYDERWRDEDRARVSRGYDRNRRDRYEKEAVRGADHDAHVAHERHEDHEDHERHEDRR